MDPQNTHEKKSLTHEITTRENFGPTKYPREKNWDPRNTHEKDFRTYEGTMARWHETHETHETHDDMKPTEFSTLNFIKSVILLLLLYNFTH